MSEILRKLDTTTSSMDVVSLNNLIVKMRPTIKQAQVQLIHKLTKQVKIMRTRKCKNEEETAKLKLKADRLVEEIKTIKGMNLHKASKFSLGNTDTLATLSKQPNCSLKYKALVRMSEHKIVQTFVQKWRSEHEDWKSLGAFMLYKNTGRRYRKKKIVHDGVNIGVDRVLREEHDDSPSDESEDESTNDDESDNDQSDKDVTKDSVVSKTELDSVNDFNESAKEKYRNVEKVDDVNVVEEKDGSSSDESENESNDSELLVEDATKDSAVSKTESDSVNENNDSAKKIEIKNEKLTKIDADRKKTSSDSHSKNKSVKTELSNSVKNKSNVKEVNADSTEDKISDESKQESPKTLNDEHLFLPVRKNDMIIKKIRIDNIDEELDVISKAGGATKPIDSNSASLLLDVNSSENVNSKTVHRKKDSFFMSESGEVYSSSEDEINENEEKNDEAEDDPTDSVGRGREMFESVFTKNLSADPEVEKEKRRKWLASTWRERPNKPNPYREQPKRSSDSNRGSSQVKGGGHGGTSREDRSTSAVSKNDKIGNVGGSEKLHPSWEASKKRKEQNVIPRFEGKKIKFDDSD